MKIIKLKKAAIQYFLFFKEHGIFILYLFCILFSPPIFPNINFIIPLAFLSVILIVREVKKCHLQIKTLLNHTLISFFTKGFLLYISCVCIVILINLFTANTIDINQIAFVIYRCLLICPILLVCILYVMIWIQKKNYGIKEFMLCLLLAASLQGILSLVCLISPNIKEIFIKIMLFGTNDPLLTNPWHLERRFFGFANNMYDGYGFGTGLLLGLCFFCASQWTAKFLIFVPILFFPAFLNSRTGLVIFVLGFLIAFPLFLKNKNRKIFLLSAVVLLFIMAVVFLFIYLFSKPTFQWLMGILNIGGVDASLVKLFGKEFWNFPNGLQLLFGSGHTLYRADGFAHSDVGFVNDLWLSGILGTGFLYGLLFVTFKRVFSSLSDKPLKALIIYLGVAMIFYNIKSISITCNVGLIVVLLLVFILDIDNRRHTLEKIRLG